MKAFLISVAIVVFAVFIAWLAVRNLPTAPRDGVAQPIFPGGE